MPPIPGLRSCYAKVGRLVYFGRMLDKVRLAAAGQLPADYLANVGDARPLVFDARCCRFLGIRHEDLRAQVLAGLGDGALLEWAHAHGTPRTDDECDIWNRFMMKLGWRDHRSAALQERIHEFGQTGRPIETFFDLFDFDEGRDPVAARAWEMRPAQAILLMGVSGSGKTTVGLQLAAVLGWAFRDGDDFHPPANIAKMSAGLPLDDADRAPWLAAIHGYLADRLAAGESVVVTCSALKERYRAQVVPDPARVRLVLLQGDFALILRRINERQGHFMKETLLRSQFEALEAPAGALTLDVAKPPDVLVKEIRQAFGL